MPKLTKAQAQDLNHILGRLQKVQTFILDSKTEVIIESGSIGKYPINKEAGSELCYLYRAAEELQNFIQTQTT